MIQFFLMICSAVLVEGLEMPIQPKGKNSCLDFCSHAGTDHKSEQIALAFDVSGSMSQDRKDEAMVAGGALALTVVPRHWTAVIVPFNESATAHRFKLQGDGLKKARRFIFDLPIGGGTNYKSAIEKLRDHRGPTIILSDGMDQGDRSQLLGLIKKYNIGPIHTIAVSAPPKAQKLLLDIAALTKGSFTSISKSEDLVKAYVNIAQYLGKYRVYQTNQTPIDLSKANGNVFVFGYNCVPTLQTSPVTQFEVHPHTKLPGEHVHVVPLTLSTPTKLSIGATKKRSATARIAILRNDLAQATVTVDTPNGVVPAGGKLKFGVGFKDLTGKPLDPRKGGFGAKAQLIDPQTGKILEETEPRPDPKHPRLQGMLPVPNVEKTLNLRVITADKTTGVPFVSQNEIIVQAKKPIALTVEPEKLSVNAKVGVVNTSLKVWMPSGTDKPSFAVRIANTSTPLRLLEALPKNDSLHLRFNARKPGIYQGHLVVEASATDAIFVPKNVAYKFEIRPAFLGLKLQPNMTIKAGPILAGAGRTPIATLKLPTLDDHAADYVIGVPDLSNGAAIIPLQADPVKLAIAPDKPGVATLTADIGDVAPATFATTVKIARVGSTKTYDVRILLSISDPILTKPIDVGRVQVGRILPAQLGLENLGNAKCTLNAKPQEFKVEGGEIAVALPKEFVLLPKQRHKFDIKIAVSPLITSRGEKEFALTLKRPDGGTVRVPVRISLAGADGPSALLVAPNALKLTAKPNAVVKFAMRVKCGPAATGNGSLSAKIGVFEIDGKSVDIPVDFQFPDGKILGESKAVVLNGFLVAPRATGNYRATIVIQSTEFGSESIPMGLLVKEE